MPKIDDISNNFEEHRKKIDDSFGIMSMPVDAKGRVVTIVALVLILVTIWFMLEIAIITFILTFVFYHLHKYAMRGLSKTIFRFMPSGIVLLLLYVGVIFFLVYFAMHNTPLIVGQLGNIGAAFSRFNFEKFLTDFDPNLKWFSDQIDFNEYVWKAGEAIVAGIASFGTVALNFLISLVLSFLFVLEKDKIAKIGETIKTSRIAFIYRYFLLFAGSFCYTFGKVMKVQVVIAAINCAISMVYLSITGFPYLMAFGIMIFILGLIPVAGVFISLVPLTIVAFSVGGIFKVLEIIIMIAIIHAIEAYFLNPKLMSRRTSLPVSLVFVVLIISERYLGAWGMLIGVPVFIYVLNVLNIDYRRAMEEEILWKAKKAEENRKNKSDKNEKTPLDKKNLFKRKKQ